MSRKGTVTGTTANATDRYQRRRMAGRVAATKLMRRPSNSRRSGPVSSSGRSPSKRGWTYRIGSGPFPSSVGGPWKPRTRGTQVWTSMPARRSRRTGCRGRSDARPGRRTDRRGTHRGQSRSSRRTGCDRSHAREDYRATQAVTLRAYPRAMTRRADPERIFIARRIAIRNRLMSSGMDQVTAERWCAAWENRGDRAGAGPIWRLLAGRRGMRSRRSEWSRDGRAGDRGVRG